MSVVYKTAFGFKMTDYSKFLESKAVTAQQRGMSSIPTLRPHLFQFQKHCVEFGLRAGSFGLFLDTGLGKTACELEWATHAAEASNGMPMTPERRAEIEGRVAEFREWQKTEFTSVDADVFATRVEELLADSAYWREKIASYDPVAVKGGYSHCAFCQTYFDHGGDSKKIIVVHEPDCAWVLAGGKNDA